MAKKFNPGERIRYTDGSVGIVGDRGQFRGSMNCIYVDVIWVTNNHKCHENGGYFVTDADGNSYFRRV